MNPSVLLSGAACLFLATPGAGEESGVLRFQEPFYEAFVEEESTEGLQDILRVRAIVPKGVAGRVRYEMSSLVDSRSQDFFSIDAGTGAISANGKLDREFMASHYFKVTARVGDAATATTTVKVVVVDINDNSPTFEKAQYNISVHESSPIGTALLTVRASDADEKENGLVSYSLSAGGSGGIFSIDSSSGVISLQMPLDREMVAVHNLQVIAIDNAAQNLAKSAKVPITIQVLDDNDNYPQFERSTYHFFVSESHLWQDKPSFGQVCATDKDSGTNALIRYSIIGGNTAGTFDIGKDTGEIRLVRPLDREAQDSFLLIVRAFDLGNPPKSNTTKVTVTVTDVNDNAPQFPNARYHQTVSENVARGYSILQIKAYDLDADQNAKLTYRIKRDEGAAPGPFAIEGESGWIKTTTNLDREVSETFTFSVEANDGGNPSQKSVVPVTIEILDANDNDPSFTQSEYTVTVSELSPLGATVTTVRAFDGDKGGYLRYEISGGNSRNRFTISSQDGQGIIRLAQPLNFKQESSFTLTVNAIDEGGRFGSCSVVIKVVDANDHPPRFQNTPYFADIFEDVMIGHTVLMLYASDEDSLDNGKISYKLISASREFSVESSTGALVVTGSLDRESVSTYILSVRASDNGNPQLSDETDVEISVLDVNDNKPRFSKSVYSGHLSENAAVGTKVLRVTANDLDQRDNGKITFELGEGSDVGFAFVIDKISGDIRSNVTLDREAKADYEFTVLARDGGNPPLYGQAMVKIDVLDVNDNPPKFVEKTVSFSLKENSPYGTKVGKVEAVDPDIGDNAQITFVLLNSTDSKHFYLGEYDEQGGIFLFVSREFDYEKDKRRYDLVIRAESPPLRTDTDIVVTLEDVNDNQPVLSDFRILHNIGPDEAVPTIIGQVPAFDADPTSRLTYNFTHGNSAGLLSIGPTGEIQLSQYVESNVNIWATFGILVSDGQNNARAQLSLQLNHVTKKMLLNSVTLRLANATKETFLDPFLLFLEEALAVVVPCAVEEITIFGVKANYDEINSMNMTFSIARRGGNSHEDYLAPSYIKQRIYLFKETLESISSLTLLPFSDDICVKEPCLNFERCVTVPRFGNNRSKHVQGSVTFVSIETLLTYSCSCPSGFTGLTTRYTCDTKIDLCYSSPCANNGTCVSAEENVRCICPAGFAGKFCELTQEKCQLECERCDCKECDDACHSDFATRSFFSGAYMAFPELKQRVSLKVSLEFATRERNGLLFFNGRLDDQNDFVALELRDSDLLFHYSTGTSYQEVRLSHPKGFADGNFHTAEVFYDNGAVTLSADECDKRLALVSRDITLAEELRCANATSASNTMNRKGCGSFLNQCSKFLDLTGPFLIGAMSPQIRRDEITQRSFTGCIRNVFVDGSALRWTDVVFNNGSAEGCPAKGDFCANAPCQNGGTCQNNWGTYFCRCPGGWKGKDCEENTFSPAKLLSPSSEILFRNQLVPIRFPWVQAISFKTSLRDAPLLEVGLENDAVSVIMVEDGAVHYILDDLHMTLQGIDTSDNEWHHIQVKWMLNETWISLDYGLLEKTKPYYNYKGGTLVSRVQVGGDHFLGCVQVCTWTFSCTR